MSGRASLSPPTRGLAAFALLCVVLGNAVLAGLGQPDAWSEALHFATGTQGVDSWRPMQQARLHVERHPEQPLYPWLFFEQRIKFIYPPTSLLLLDALEGPVPRRALRSALNLASWCLVWIAVAFSVALFDRVAQAHPATRAAGSRDRAARLALLALLGLSFYPLLKAYTLGQLQVWVNAGFAACLYAWVADRKALAGALVALMAAAKPHYGLLLVWGLLRREWRFGLAASLTGLGLLALSIARYGFQAHWDYLAVMGHVSLLGEAYWPNQTWNGFLQRLLGNGESARWDPHVYPPYHLAVHLGTLAAAAVLLGAALVRPARRGGAGSACDLAAMTLALTMASPVAWEHHYGVLLPVLALLFPMLWARPLHGHVGLTILAVAAAVADHGWLALGHLSGTPWNPLQSLLLAAALGVFALALARCDTPTGRAAGSGDAPAS